MKKNHNQILQLRAITTCLNKTATTNSRFVRIREMEILNRMWYYSLKNEDYQIGIREEDIFLEVQSLYSFDCFLKSNSVRIYNPLFFRDLYANSYFNKKFHFSKNYNEKFCCNFFNEPVKKQRTISCFNCLATETPMWRKHNGRDICNACGLYYRINGYHRPPKLNRKIQQRKRKN